MAEKYRPPIVLVGTPIQWFRTRSDARQGLNPCAAMVTRNDGMSLNCYAIPPDSFGGNPKSGVRHFEDPDVGPNHDKLTDAGYWREIPENPKDPQILAVKDIVSGKTGEKQNAVQGTIVTSAEVAGSTK